MGQWTQLSPATSPPARADHCMAFDRGRGVVVLHGGTNPSGTIQVYDTWEWDGTTWTEVTTAAHPPITGPMTYDENLGLILLQAITTVPSTSESWTYNGVNWVKLSPATSPTAVFAPGMVYSPALAKTILFGGQTGGCNSDTWSFNGTTWTLESPVASPEGRAQLGLVYDQTLSRVVKLLGRCTIASYTTRVWTYNGTTWTEVVASPTPSARAMFASAYVPSCGKTVIFSGDGPSDNETWSFDGTNWTQETPATSPAGRFNFGAEPFMCENTDESSALLFGGQAFAGAGTVTYGDTWVYSCDAIPDVGAGVYLPPTLVGTLAKVA